MLFLNQDIELSLDLRRQHEYLNTCSYEDPYFNMNEGSSLMQVVSACGNVQAQSMVPLGDDACRMAFHLQPGPIPGVTCLIMRKMLDMNDHLMSFHGQAHLVVPTSETTLQAAKKRSTATPSSQQRSSEGSPMPASKRAKSSVVQTSFRGY